MSDRVVVMHEGRLAGELAREQLTEEARDAAGDREALRHEPNSRVSLRSLLVGLYASAARIVDPMPRSIGNLIDVANRQGFYGVITLGAALVIITGGIDLSIGSVVGSRRRAVRRTSMQHGVHPFARGGAGDARRVPSSG